MLYDVNLFLAYTAYCPEVHNSSVRSSASYRIGLNAFWWIFKSVFQTFCCVLNCCYKWQYCSQQAVKVVLVCFFKKSTYEQSISFSSEQCIFGWSYKSFGVYRNQTQIVNFVIYIFANVSAFVSLSRLIISPKCSNVD